MWNHSASRFRAMIFGESPEDMIIYIFTYYFLHPLHSGRLVPMVTDLYTVGP